MLSNEGPGVLRPTRSPLNAPGVDCWKDQHNKDRVPLSFDLASLGNLRVSGSIAVDA